ncbi:MAG: hypothetical protein ABEK16_05645 [Candidatus Nanohalobium sp.]
MTDMEYSAGACNINRVESRKRLVVGIAGFVNSIILIAVLFFVPELTPLYPAIFLLNFTGFIGYLQYRRNFCTGLALKKKFHVGDEEQEVEDPEKISRDRKQAALMLFESTVLAGLLTAAVYLAITNF